jgi:hypothetical protein
LRAALLGSEIGDVSDLIFVLVVVAFFTLALGVVAACDRIAPGDGADGEHPPDPEAAP